MIGLARMAAVVGLGLVMAGPSQCSMTVSTDPTIGPMVKHAASELARYILLMKPDARMSGGGASDPRFVVTCLGSQDMARITRDSGWKPSANVRPGAEGFAIRSLKPDGRPTVVIAGADGKGALNGVYHYLEHICGVGFFPDGEQIPRLAEIPVDNLNIVETPRFRYRANLPLDWGIGIRDYFCRMWTLDDWKRHIDWMAKKKLNVLTLYIEAVDKLWGDVFAEAFPEVRAHGYPRTEDVRVFAPEYRTKLMKQVYAYARERGVRFQPVLFWGAVEETYKLAHPELKYIKGTYSQDNWYISADQPECRQAMEKLWGAFLKEFGADHLYRLDLIMEAPPTGMDSRDIYRQARNLVRKLDPKAEVVAHWNYAWLYGNCTFDDAAKDIAQSKEDVTVEDWVDMQSSMKVSDRMLAEAKCPRWAATYWNTGWNMDLYAPTYQTLVDLIHRQAADPLYVGMYAAAGDLAATLNPLAADMMCEMSWRPDRVASAESFVRDYAMRRHGVTAGRDRHVLSSYGKMLAASTAYNRKLWSGNKGTANVISYGWEPSNFFSSNNSVVPDDTRESIRLFDESLSDVPAYGPVADAPFMAEHRFRLEQTRLFEEVEMQYVLALTEKDKASRLAAIDRAIQATIARRWLLRSNGRKDMRGTLDSLRREGLELLTWTGKPDAWGWLGGYDSVEALDLLRLPKLQEVRRQISEDKETPLPWAPVLNQPIPAPNQ